MLAAAIAEKKVKQTDRERIKFALFHNSFFFPSPNEMESVMSFTFFFVVSFFAILSMFVLVKRSRNRQHSLTWAWERLEKGEKAVQQSGTKTKKRLRSLRIDLRERESLFLSEQIDVSVAHLNLTLLPLLIKWAREKRRGHHLSQTRFVFSHFRMTIGRRERERKNNTHSHNTLLQIS